MSSSQMLSVGSPNLSARSPNPFRAPSPAAPRPSTFPPSPPESTQSLPPPDRAASSSSLPWPSNDPSLVLFFDPFSDRAQEIKEGIERKLLLEGATLLTSTSVKRATHILLDPAEGELNATLRARDGRPVQGREDEDVRQRVVKLEWAMMSFIRGVGAPEEEYSFNESGGEQQAEAGTNEVVGEVDPVGRVEHDASEYVNPKVKNKTHAWLKVEEEQLVVFLASLPEKKGWGYGLSTWRQYAGLNTKRTATAYQQHYLHRQLEIDAMATSLRDQIGGAAGVHRPAAAVQHAVPNIDHQSASQVSVAPKGSLPLRRKRNRQKGQRPGLCFVCGVTSASDWRHIPGFSKQACGSCRSCHYVAEKIESGSGVSALEKKRNNLISSGKHDGSGLKPLASFAMISKTAAIFDDFSSDASDSSSDLSDMDIDHDPPSPAPAAAEVSQQDLHPSPDAPSSAKRPKLILHAQPPPFRSSSPVASGSGPSHTYAPRISTPQHQSPPLAAPRPPHAPAHIPLLPIHAHPSSAREPATFANMGVPPSHHPPHLPYCFFCGDGDAQSAAPFSDLALVAADPAKGDGVLHRVPSKTGCGACWGWYEGEKKRLGDAEGEKEEMERMARVTRGLLERGLEIRAGKVQGESGLKGG